MEDIIAKTIANVAQGFQEGGLVPTGVVPPVTGPVTTEGAASDIQAMIQAAITSAAGSFTEYVPETKVVTKVVTGAAAGGAVTKPVLPLLSDVAAGLAGIEESLWGLYAKSIYAVMEAESDKVLQTRLTISRAILEQVEDLHKFREQY